MGYLFSWSKAASTIGLDVSEWLLLISGVVLVFGIFGEYKKLPTRLLLWPTAVFEILVMVGVAGELLGDGGVFAFSSHLQSIEDGELRTLGSEADKLDLRLKSLNTKTDMAGMTADAAVENSNEAASVSSRALRLAQSAESRVAEAIRRTAALESQLEWRTLSQQQANTIRTGIPATFKGLKVSVSHLASDSEGAQYASEIADVLTASGILINGPNASLITGPAPQGVFIRIPQIDVSVRNSPAAVIQQAFRAAGIDAQGVAMADAPESSIELLIGIKPRPATPKK
jgi:hypothetical protein